MTVAIRVNVDALNEKRELAGRFVQANRDLTDWISKNPAEAQKIVKPELLVETRRDMSAELIAHAWKRMIFTSEIPRGSVQVFLAQFAKSRLHQNREYLETFRNALRR